MSNWVNNFDNDVVYNNGAQKVFNKHNLVVNIRNMYINSNIGRINGFFIFILDSIITACDGRYDAIEFILSRFKIQYAHTTVDKWHERNVLDIYI